MRVDHAYGFIREQDVVIPFLLERLIVSIPICVAVRGPMREVTDLSEECAIE